jgi:hypothetical protein
MSLRLTTALIGTALGPVAKVKLMVFMMAPRLKDFEFAF